MTSEELNAKIKELYKIFRKMTSKGDARNVHQF